MADLHSMLSREELSQLKDCTSLVPRYLFRTFSESSKGVNSPPVFLSDVTIKDCHHQSLYEIPKDEAKHMIEHHLLWGREPTEFISWTSSLLWALQYAVRKRIKSKEQNVNICVLDTQRAQLHSSLFPVSTLLSVYDIPGRGRGTYYQAEYLAHSKVDVSSESLSVISFEALITSGLFEFLPELNDEEGREFLAKRVNQLRCSYFAQSCKVSPKELRIAKELASGFGMAYVLPMSLAFLSLRRRERNDWVLLHGVAPLNTSDLEPQLKSLFLYPNITGPIVPEVSEFACLIDEVCGQVQTQSERQDMESSSSNNNIYANALQRLSPASTTSESIHLYPDLDFLSESQYLEAVCGDWSDYNDDNSTADDEHETAKWPTLIDCFTGRGSVALVALLHRFLTYICDVFISSSAFLLGERSDIPSQTQ